MTSRQTTTGHRLTPMRAIAAKCRDCIYDPAAPGSWRAQVAQCSCVSCPLWPLRPAPESGPFANPPRDPETVSRKWASLPAGAAKSQLPPTYPDGAATPLQTGPGSALLKRSQCP